MADNAEIRWKQRYSNLDNALTFLEESIKQGSHSQLEKAGIIQSFEFTFELAWKTMKDFLNEKGLNALYPRDVIKEAFQNDLVQDGEKWLDMLESRNLMSHTYKSDDSEKVYEKIVNEYTGILNELATRLKQNL